MKLSEVQQEKILVMGNEGIRPKAVANKLMLPTDLVSAFLRRNGIYQKSSSGIVTVAETNKIAELWRAGVPVVDIAEQVGHTYPTIKARIAKLQRDGVIDMRRNDTKEVQL